MKRIRSLPLRTNTNPRRPEFDIPADPIYDPLRNFLNAQSGQYHFTLIELLHAASVKMMGWRKRRAQNVMLFATGGLYLALNKSHANLAFTRMYGDFTSSFSHSFGDALAVMILSQAYGCDYHKMVPIPVKGKREMDYQIALPNGGVLRLEAKGITSQQGLSGARTSAYSKKILNPTIPASGKRTYSRPTASVATITKAARPDNPTSFIEIIDPPFDVHDEALRHVNQLAGQYLHYAAIAHFAGLYPIADEFYERAASLISNQEPAHFTRRKTEFLLNNSFITVNGRRIVGIHWPLGDQAPNSKRVWLYQGVDVEFIRRLLQEGEIGNSEPYSALKSVLHSEPETTAESILPDGSYFGIGVGQHPKGLTPIDQDTNMNDLKLVSLG